MKGIFGERLKIARKAKGLTTVDLSGLLSVAQNTITRWEAGTREPDIETIQKIAATLGTTVSYLMGEAEEPQSNARADAAKSSGKIIRVPVYGREAAACCGNGFADMEHVVAEAGDYIDMPAGFIGPFDPERHPFIIYAEGDSMIDAGIADGSQVIINPADPVLDGDAALVDFAMTPVAHSIAVKRVYWLDGGAIEIRSACGDGWKRTFTRDDAAEKSIRIIGKVEWVGHKPRRG